MRSARRGRREMRRRGRGGEESGRDTDPRGERGERAHERRAHDARRSGGPGGPSDTGSGDINRALLDHVILNGGIIDGEYQPPAQRIAQYVAPTMPSNLAPGSPIVITVRNVGYLRKLRLVFSFTVTGGGTTTATKTELGLTNIFSNITLQDYAGNRRVNCDGWFLVYLAASKRKWNVEGSAYTTDTPLNIANRNPATVTAANWAGWNAPATLGAAATAVCTGVIDVPLTVNDADLRGLLDAQVTEVVTTLTATINPNFAVVSGADPTFAVFQSGGTDLPTISNFSLVPYQYYLYDLPKRAGREIIPAENIATAYYLETVPFAILNNNVDNYYQYTNRRRFLSTFAIFDNGGSLNFGTDLNRIRILSASQTPLLDFDPHAQLYDQRLKFGSDLPRGMYFMNHRGDPDSMVPIDTRVYGNMQFAINPNALNPGSSLRFGFEQLVGLGDVRQGPSLASR